MATLEELEVRVQNLEARVRQVEADLQWKADSQRIGPEMVRLEEALRELQMELELRG